MYLALVPMGESLRTRGVARGVYGGVGLSCRAKDRPAVVRAQDCQDLVAQHDVGWAAGAVVGALSSVAKYRQLSPPSVLMHNAIRCRVTTWCCTAKTTVKITAVMPGFHRLMTPSYDFGGGHRQRIPCFRARHKRGCFQYAVTVRSMG